MTLCVTVCLSVCLSVCMYVCLDSTLTGCVQALDVTALQLSVLMTTSQYT